MQKLKHQPRSLRGPAALLTSIFLVNLIFASIAYAAAMIEWSPATGVVVGNTDGQAYSPGEQARTQIVRSDFGGTPFYFVEWIDSDNNGIYISRYNANGVIQSGFPLQLKTNSSAIGHMPRMVSDTAGGIITAWSDARNQSGVVDVNDLFGERIDKDGNFIWNDGSPNGITLVSTASSDTIGDAVPDGNGGIAIAYSQNTSTDSFDEWAYVIRIDGNGALSSGWPTNGRAVPATFTTSSSVGFSYLHMVQVNDDTATETGDIFPDYMVYWGPAFASAAGFQARKIYSTGVAAWAAQAVIPGSVGAAQAQDRIASDGAGGAYLFRHTNTAWLAYHLLAGGTFDNSFGTSGALTIGTFSSTSLYQEEITVTNDGSTGAVAVFPNVGSTTNDLRAVRFSNTGSITWSQLINTNEGGRDAEISRDPAGNFTVIWNNETENRLYLQRVNAASGLPQFTPEIQLTTGLNNGTENIAAEPDQLWFTGMSSYGNIAYTDNNEALVVWDREQITNFIQRTDLTDGTIDFTADAQAIEPNISIEKSQVGTGGTRTSDGDFILVWHDTSTETSPGSGPVAVKAEKFDTAGNRLWNPGAPGDGDQIATDYGEESFFRVIPTDDGGALVFWEGSGSPGGMRQIYGQRIDSNGEQMWDPLGTVISSDFYEATNVEVVSDGNNGAYVSWQQENDLDSANEDIFVNHIQASDGTTDPSWNGGAPKLIDTFSRTTNVQRMISLDTNNLIVVYSGGQVEAAKLLKSNGSLVTMVSGNPWTVVGTTIYSRDLRIAPDNAGGFYVAFGINGDNVNIGVQRVNSSGTNVFSGPFGVVVANQVFNQTNPQIISDNNGSPSGVIVAWNDARAGGFTNDVYAQRIDSAGNQLWAANGVAVSSTTDGKSQLMENLESSPTTISSNGGNGAIIPFTSLESVTVNNIYAQHLNGSGIAQWTSNGELIETYTAVVDQYGYDINTLSIGDGNGGALFTWLRSTDNATTDTFAQYVSDTVGGVCSEGGASSFCGEQEISNATLSFTSIPDSFIFDPINASGSTQNVFNNGVSNPPSALGEDHDLLSVTDTRGDPGDGGLGGGFIVQVNNSTDFTDGSHIIPINSLYTVTATDATSIAGTVPINGVMYDDISTIPSGTRNITAPVDAGDIGTTATLADLENPTTYSNIFPGLPNPGSQFGNGDIVLMDGTLPETQGRNGTMYQFVNYDLRLAPANQISGAYTVILTFTLFDSTI